MTAVVGNTLVLALDRYPISTCEANILYGVNLLLTALFTAEVALKVAGASFCEYCESGWNCFDFVVVGASLIEVIAFPTSNATSNATIAAVVGTDRVIQEEAHAALERHQGCDRTCVWQ